MVLQYTGEENISSKGPTLLITAAHEGKWNPHIGKFIPSLAKAGYQIEFVGWDRLRKLPKMHQEGGALYRMIFRGWGYTNKWLMIVLPLWGLRLFFHLLFRKPDLIIAIDLDSALPASMAGFLRRMPVLYVILDTYSLRPKIPNFLRRTIQKMDNWTVKKAKHVIVPDECRILEEYQQKNKFTIVYNCCPDVSCNVPSERKDRRDKPFTALATGYLMKERGVELLLLAADRIPELHILMAGSVYENDLREKIGPNPKVKFLGKIPLEEARLLNFDADVAFTFYDPSSELNRRAASNKWADAMMASRPILANSELVKAPWIRENDMGYLCPYDDVDALVKCLEHIRDNPEETKRKGENGRRVFMEGYNWEAMEIRLHELMEELTGWS